MSTAARRRVRKASYAPPVSTGGALLAAREIEQAYRAKQDAMEAMEALLQRLFPIGAAVEWKKGGHLQHGRVLGHRYFDGLFVQNERTGKQLGISAYDIKEALQ